MKNFCFGKKFLITTTHSLPHTHTLKFESLAHYNLKKRVVKAIVNNAFFENIWLVVMKYVIKMSKLKAFSYNKQYAETI